MYSSLTDLLRKQPQISDKLLVRSIELKRERWRFLLKKDGNVLFCSKFMSLLVWKKIV